MSADGGPSQREIAYRLFAAEYDDANLDYSESDEERAPNYVVTPTGARVNRLFAVGVLTEVESVNDDVLRARVADPTGAFVAYAGQYQPDAVAFLETTETPEFVALAGKARTFQPEDSERVYTSVRPESVNAVDADTRDRWTVSAAEATLRRVAAFADALAMAERGDDLREALLARGVDPSLASGIALAIDHYGTTTAYLEAVRQLAVDTLEVVAGDRDQVRSLDITPGEGGEVELGRLPAGVGVADAPAGGSTAEATETAGATASATDSATADDATTETSQTAETAETAEATASTAETSSADADAGTGADADADADSATGSDGESTPADAAPTQIEEMAESGTVEAESDEPDASAAETDAPAGTAAESTADEASAETGGLGDFEDVGDADAEETTGADATADAGDSESAGSAESVESTDESATATGIDESEMYELDEDEREEIESEFGTDFSTGTEVDDPGEADIETPGADATAETASESAETESADAETSDVPTEMEETAESDTAATDSTTPSEADESGAPEVDEDTADVDLEDAVVDAMEELGDGDGADREAVVAAVVDEYGVDPADADNAVDGALMSGQCYEPVEGKLKAI